MQNNNRLLTFYFDIHSQKEEIIDKPHGGLFVPSADKPVMTQTATFTEVALTFRLNFSKCLIVYQQLTSWLGELEKEEKKTWKMQVSTMSVCKEVRLRFRYSLLILKSASLQWSTITISEGEAEQLPCDLKPLSMSDKVTPHIRVLCFDKCYISTSGSG